MSTDTAAALCQHGRVLFPKRLWAGLADGSVTLTFRRWSAPRARVGARHRTPAGLLEVLAVDRVAAGAIDEADARRAGFADRAALVTDLRLGGDDEQLWRVELRHVGADPREALRRAVPVDRSELDLLRRRLDRLDGASRHGPWTRATLELIGANPEVVAAELARQVGRERLPFKADVRKLKELGLTESLPVGYRLSPRGRAVLSDLGGPTRSTEGAG